MSTILNFIRPDKKYENIQANRIAFFRMDDSFAEFIKNVEAEEFTILGIEWNSDDPCKLALILSHEQYQEKLDAPQVEPVDAIDAVPPSTSDVPPSTPPVPTTPLEQPRPSYAQRVEEYIRGAVRKND